ncbi:hypothetical protein [Corynebacterium antarcticum]|uniref:hypothetical protein n=1 Tax=Corynebacterium antarcticum TaxID=2800405 RepID=UPI002260B556|nr:hypothetical protein [Corynebacterium antarcticum]MCX7539262.1 hypothetical protein [Corynebacterium antarcticum]
MSRYFIVDVEATSATPFSGVMTEFGVVHFRDVPEIDRRRDTFHAVLVGTLPTDGPVPVPDSAAPAVDPLPVARSLERWLAARTDSRPTLVSDNPAFDFMWIAWLFDSLGRDNPFGFSARRIGDFHAGQTGDFDDAHRWKKLRRTPHTHHPVDDAVGNAEALHALLHHPAGS